MITERGGTGNGGRVFVITIKTKSIRIDVKKSRITIPCVPTTGGGFGGASRITRGGSVGGGGGR